MCQICGPVSPTRGSVAVRVLETQTQFVKMSTSNLLSALCLGLLHAGECKARTQWANVCEILERKKILDYNKRVFALRLVLR